jgi:hypothetical protein
MITLFNILTHFFEITMNFRNHTLLFSLQFDHFFFRYYWMVLFSPLILLAKLLIGQILLLKKIKVYKFLKITNSHQNWLQKLFKTHLSLKNSSWLTNARFPISQGLRFVLVVIAVVIVQRTLFVVTPAIPGTIIAARTCT